MFMILGAVVLIVLVYIVSRLVSDAVRRKKSLFRRKKNAYIDCIDKKKNPDGTVYRKSQNRNSKRKRR